MATDVHLHNMSEIILHFDIDATEVAKPNWLSNLLSALFLAIYEYGKPLIIHLF